MKGVNMFKKLIFIATLACVVWCGAIALDENEKAAKEKEAIETTAETEDDIIFSSEKLADREETRIHRYLSDPHCVSGFNDESIVDRGYDITEEKRFERFFHLDKSGDYHIYDKILNADIDEIDKYGVATPCSDNDITLSYAIFADDGVIKKNTLGGFMRYVAFHTDEMDAVESVTLIYPNDEETHKIHIQSGGSSFTGYQAHLYDEKGFCPLCGHNQEE